MQLATGYLSKRVILNCSRVLSSVKRFYTNYGPGKILKINIYIFAKIKQNYNFLFVFNPLQSHIIKIINRIKLKTTILGKILIILIEAV